MTACDITDTGVVALASGCKQLTSLYLNSCRNITDTAVMALASECKLLTTLELGHCSNITDLSAYILARCKCTRCKCTRCKLLTGHILDLSHGSKITDETVKAVASGCKLLTTLDLS